MTKHMDKELKKVELLRILNEEKKALTKRTLSQKLNISKHQLNILIRELRQDKIITRFYRYYYGYSMRE